MTPAAAGAHAPDAMPAVPPSSAIEAPAPTRWAWFPSAKPGLLALSPSSLTRILGKNSRGPPSGAGFSSYGLKLAQLPVDGALRCRLPSRSYRKFSLAEPVTCEYANDENHEGGCRQNDQSNSHFPAPLQFSSPVSGEARSWRRIQLSWPGVPCGDQDQRLHSVTPPHPAVNTGSLVRIGQTGGVKRPVGARHRRDHCWSVLPAEGRAGLAGLASLSPENRKVNSVTQPPPQPMHVGEAHPL